MPLSHICTDGATGNSDHLNRILSDLEKELRGLSERATAPDFERFEGKLHQITSRSAPRPSPVSRCALVLRTATCHRTEAETSGFDTCRPLG